MQSRFIAITRPVPRSLSRCELTHVPRQTIDWSTASAQHREYERALEAAGCLLEPLPAEPDMPDSVFVEDAAIVVGELAVIMRPGAESRRGEVASVAKALLPLRPIRYIESPGTLDGGDVVQLGATILAGQSRRSNPEGIRQLAEHLRPQGYSVRPVPVERCLHLKSAVTPVGVQTVLVNPAWVEEHLFDGMNAISVHPDEPFAANALLIGDVVLYAAEHRRTRQRLERAGIEVRIVEMSELAKAEAGITCCSLIVERRSPLDGATQSR